ncbi:S-adenosyl-L-methionine-dependent methyltransferase [Glomus cerebriforme]|uniref:S-adenosyl-L-methionine-dependent methyltransferase n=1 Tax=Glomus cerebriforme TaxID=658196 RepID=A0A397SKS2_9GLOM|nr:S-adenosyl-L-methionine-dependent methyltransferase [Glomus cerebriforme]
MKRDSDLDSNASSSSGINTEWMDSIPSYEESPYFIPDLGDDEIDHSLMQHYTYKYMCQGNFISPLKKENLKKCLEIGYGSGIWMMEMASEYPNCDFYGIDVQPNNPDSTYPDNCEFIKGDVKKGIPYPDETFDFVYLRMTMIYIESNKWKPLISEIFRVLKKGGWVEFLETDMSYKPSGKIMKSIMKFWVDMFKARNIELKLIRQFGTILSESGFVNAINKKYSVPIGSWAGALGEIRSQSFNTWLHVTADFTYRSLGFDTKEEYLNQIEKLEDEYSELKPHGDHYVAYGQKPLN